MENNLLTIILKPNYYSTAESLGFDIENEEINDDAVLYEQGLGIDELDIEPNEKFTITEDFDATIENEKLIYKVISRVDNEMFETSNYDNIITLDTGKYLLQSDGKTIELLSSLD